MTRQGSVEYCGILKGKEFRLAVKRKANDRNLRCNERIRISPIRLIDQDNNQVGIVDTRQALETAQKAGMDLVEVAPQSRPPVCRIMDYGKWKYSQNKREQKAKAHRHEVELKQVRIRTPKIGDHDLEIKIGRAREFLERGDRVQFTLRFRGRELAHIEEGRKVFHRIADQLEEISKVDQHVRREGRRITMSLSPTGKQSKPKHPTPQQGEPEQAQPAPDQPTPAQPEQS